MNHLPPFGAFGHTPQRAFILLAAVLISPMALLATSTLLGTRPTEPSSASSDHVVAEGRRSAGVTTSSGNATAPSGRVLTLVPPAPTAASSHVDAAVAVAGQTVTVRPSLPSTAVQSALIGGAALAGLLVGIALARTDPRLG